jgi:hypothetical protein
MCEIESDFSPLRWRVAAVLHRALGIPSADLCLETRFMVRAWVGAELGSTAAAAAAAAAAAEAGCVSAAIRHHSCARKRPLTGRHTVHAPRATTSHNHAQVQRICRLVTRRSARLAASLLVAVLRLQGWMELPRRLVVAVDGGVFLKYHNWRKFLDAALREAFGERCVWGGLRAAWCAGWRARAPWCAERARGPGLLPPMPWCAVVLPLDHQAPATAS